MACGVDADETKVIGSTQVTPELKTGVLGPRLAQMTNRAGEHG